MSITAKFDLSDVNNYISPKKNTPYDASKHQEMCLVVIREQKAALKALCKEENWEINKAKAIGTVCVLGGATSLALGIAAAVLVAAGSTALSIGTGGIAPLFILAALLACIVYNKYGKVEEIESQKVLKETHPDVLQYSPQLAALHNKQKEATGVQKATSSSTQNSNKYLLNE